MRKKLFAILMSAMMMVTFMPAMAFADATAKATFTEGYNSIVVTKGAATYEIDTVKYLHKGTTNWTGKVLAVVDADKLADDASITDLDVLNAFNGAKAYYYDVNGAVLQYKKSSVDTDLPSKFAKSDFEGIFTDAAETATKTYAVTGIKIKAPKDVVGYVNNAGNTFTTSADAAKDKQILALSGSGSFSNWTATFEKPKYDKDSFEEQKFTVAVKFTATDTVEESNKETPDLVGTVTKDLTIAKSVPTLANAKFYIDSTAKTALTFTSKIATAPAVAYDGAEHKVVMNDLPGYTVTYSKFNSSTGKWDVCDPVFKEVKDSTAFKAYVENTTDKTDHDTFTINVSVSQSTVTIKYDQNAANQAFQACDPESFLTADGNTYALDAMAANKEALKAWFAERYELTTTPKTYSNEVVLGIKDKTTDNGAALAVKYADVFANIQPTVNAATLTIKVQDPEAALADEVEFTVAPTTKTYKAKKLKKAAKSFTVKAEAISGKAVSYKLINATTAKIKIDKTTGKITLKKGLKKGTYKFKVKAYTQVGNGYYAASETQNITVKVKK